MFPEEERKLIEELRPGGSRVTDGYTWDYTKAGHYTVKSGYWRMCELSKAKTLHKEVDQPSLDALFQLAWKTKASPKVHHFLWRCLSNSLSVASNLKSRHIAREAECTRCKAAEETTNHLLFTCPYARLIWAISPVPAPPSGQWSDSLYSNLYRIMNPQWGEEMNERVKQIGPWILWRIWKNRNAFIFQGVDFDAEDTIRKVQEDAEAWVNCREEIKQTLHQSNNRPGRRRWKRPMDGWVKCNTDGAWPKEGVKSGIGWVLRDHEGRMLWMGAKAIPKVRTVIETEVEALRWAMMFIKSLRYSKVVFESDSEELIRLINEDEDWPALSPVINDMKGIKSSFKEVAFVYQPRECNGVADRVAKEALSFVNDAPKMYTIVPSWVKNQVEVDNQSVNA